MRMQQQIQVAPALEHPAGVWHMADVHLRLETHMKIEEL